ncbi:hypothetical protein PV419_43035, partial [Streptomyces sp. ME19-01-6]|nr:hypothetical protein [Streptomyces sp. ME19-01-6]
MVDDGAAGAHSAKSAADPAVGSSRPTEIHVLDGPEPAWMVGLDVPKALLSLPMGHVDRLLARRLSGHEGMGALLAGFLTRLIQDTASYRPSDGPRLEVVLVDLLSALLAQHLDADSSAAIRLPLPRSAGNRIPPRPEGLCWQRRNSGAQAARMRASRWEVRVPPRGVPV